MFSTIDKIMYQNYHLPLHFNRLQLHHPVIIKLALPASHFYLTSTAKITFAFQKNVTSYQILWQTSFTDLQTTAIILPIHVQYNSAPSTSRVSTNP